jgi:hypothetical protein
MQDHRDTPPYSGSNTPDIKSTASTSPDPATPNSLDTSAPGDAPQTLNIPNNLTQDIVDADPDLKRVQQDLLLLTGFNDNETLHWRPSWFPQANHAGQYWTLHNPPNVVTELLPHDSSSEYPGRVYTRRMRQLEDPPARYIKDWSHWHRVCDLMGVPHDFLCEEHVQLLRLGLLRDEQGALICELNILCTSTVYVAGLIDVYVQSSADVAALPRAPTPGTGAVCAQSEAL